MPGYTKAQLVERGTNVTQYAWCRQCRLYWSKRSIKKHQPVGSAALTVVLAVPPSPKPKKGDVVIIHPAHEQFLNFLADAMAKELLAEHRARAATSKSEASPRGRKSKARSRHSDAPLAPSAKELEYTVLTVDEAVGRLGLTRAAIMAEFDEVQRAHDEEKQRRPRSAPRSRGSGQST